MHNLDKRPATFTVQPIPEVDPRITRIVAEYETGHTTTAGLLFTGDDIAHEEAADTIARLTDTYDIPAGDHWHRQSETDGTPQFRQILPRTDGDEWLRFAADYGISLEAARSVLTSSHQHGCTSSEKRRGSRQIA